MTQHPDEATVATVKHYLIRCAAILAKLSQDPRCEGLLAVRLAPDMEDTGFQFGVAIQFAARALCPPVGLIVPDMPDDITCDTLQVFAAQVETLIAPITANELTRTVTHCAGLAELTQAPDDYLTRYALPNMLFHLGMGYAGLRHAGMTLGKADFDDFHRYEN